MSQASPGQRMENVIRRRSKANWTTAEDQSRVSQLDTARVDSAYRGGIGGSSGATNGRLLSRSCQCVASFSLSTLHSFVRKIDIRQFPLIGQIN